MDATKDQPAILFDLNMCSGCKKCVAACMHKQGFPGDPDKVETLSATTYTVVKKTQSPDGDDYNYRNMCRHCLVPSCASVCPVGAIHKSELGPVVYDPDKCMGCRYCMVACPFNIPRYEWDNPVPAVRKCDMCIDRQKEGKIPACAEACTYGATMFGTRDELLAEARSRIADDPDSYHPHIYGEKEIGGTSVLFLSPFPLEDLGYDPKLGDTPMPEHTWAVLSKVPGIALFAGATMSALWWLTWRRDEVKAYEAKQKAEKARGTEPNGPTHGNGHTKRGV